MAQDNEHLNLLSIACTVVGIVLCLLLSFPLIHVAVGLMMLSGVIPSKPSDATPLFVGWFFVLLGSAFVLGGWLIGGLTIYAGRCIRRREKRVFIQVVAAILCLFMPIGTILGVFLLIVLNRPSAVTQFDA